VSSLFAGTHELRPAFPRPRPAREQLAVRLKEKEPMENVEDRSTRNALLQQLADKENIMKLAVATAAIFLTNIGKYLLSLDHASRWFFDVVGVSPKVYFYSNLRTLVVAILIIGYGGALFFIYRKFIARLPRQKKNLYGPVAAVSAAVLCVVNIYFLPRQPDRKVLIPTDDWSNRIAKSQASNGGIYAKASDPSAPTQVWTTAQALLGLIADQEHLDQSKIHVIHSAFQYIEKNRHPAPAADKPNEFDEGWGLFEKSKHSTTEIAAWVTLAHIRSLESSIRIWEPVQAATIRDRVKRDLALILQRQSNDGGWRPIKQDGPKFTRTYSTAMALWSLIEARRSKDLRETIGTKYDPQISTGIDWLLKNYTTIKPDGVTPQKLGWVPNPNRTGQREQFAGLTAQVLFVLSRIEAYSPFKERLRENAELLEYKRAFLENDQLASRFVCSNDRIHDFDLSFTGPDTLDFVLEGSTLLWFPWSYAALSALANDGALTPQEQAKALSLRKSILDSKVEEISKFVDDEFMYVLAEHLYCFSVSP
jgi:hypothetical protein